MLTKRVIPCLDVKDGRVVKGVNFVDLRDAGDPVELAAKYDREGADEVVFLDITATSDDRSTTIDLGQVRPRGCRRGRLSRHHRHLGRPLDHDRPGLARRKPAAHPLYRGWRLP